MSETAVRQPNRFLADLMATMRSAAETARHDTVAQCRADAEAWTGEVRAHAADEAAALRAAADADVAAIREWSRGEIERIRIETEARVAARSAAVDKEIRARDSAVAAEAGRVEAIVSGFERDVTAFCDRLLAEEDAAAFAALAARMPDPPSFGRAPEPEPTPEPARPALIAVPVHVEAPARSVAQPRNEPARPSLAAVPASAPAAAADVLPEAELDAQRIGARLAGSHGGSRSTAGESTRIVVVGLVGVASIAAFKRQLGRLQGVRSVAVSSGPDGEFVFTATHGADVHLDDLLPAIPGFGARVISRQAGHLDVSAHDPETESQAQ